MGDFERIVWPRSTFDLYWATSNTHFFVDGCEDSFTIYAYPICDRLGGQALLDHQAHAIPYTHYPDLYNAVSLWHKNREQYADMTLDEFMAKTIGSIDDLEARVGHRWISEMIHCNSCKGHRHESTSARKEDPAGGKGVAVSFQQVRETVKRFARKAWSGLFSF